MILTRCIGRITRSIGLDQDSANASYSSMREQAARLSAQPVGCHDLFVPADAHASGGAHGDLQAGSFSSQRKAIACRLAERAAQPSVVDKTLPPRIHICAVLDEDVASAHPPIGEIMSGVMLSQSTVRIHAVLKHFRDFALRTEAARLGIVGLVSSSTEEASCRPPA